MYAPIYLPQSAPKSPEVEATERAIIQAEGSYHVGGRYFANDSDARQERRRLAERSVREVQRRAAYGGCLRGTCDGNARFHLSTLATPRERQQVDAGAIECVRTLHRETLAEVGADLANGAANGVLISAARVCREHVPTVRALVQGFPSQIVVGLVADVQEHDAVAASLLFGQAGIRAVADVRTAQGWTEFRDLFDCGNQPEPFIRQALTEILRDIGDAPTETDARNEFFRLVFSPRVTSAKELANRLGVLPSTLMSRFFRAALPSPKHYVAYARLVWAAYLGESPAMSIAAIANRLNASSPQSFHRTVRTTMGMSAACFRELFNGTRMLESLRSRLIAPYRETLRTFDPLATLGPTFARRRAPTRSNRFNDDAEKGRAA
jgi:AraC-like DNA-binding protein